MTRSIRKAVWMFAWCTVALVWAGNAAADETTAEARVFLTEVGGPIGVAVKLGCKVIHPVRGNSYDLYYQIRVHTKKGELGPLLGTADSPRGRAFLVKSLLAGSEPVVFDEELDITRGALSGMTNFKPWKSPMPGRSFDALLRVEAHVFDGTNRKFLPRSGSSDLILVAHFYGAGKVASLEPLTERIRQPGVAGRSVAEPLAMLAEMDPINLADNRIDHALFAILASDKPSPETKLAVLKLIPLDGLGTKSMHSYNLIIVQLSKSDHAAIKSAALKIVDVMKERGFQP